MPSSLHPDPRRAQLEAWLAALPAPHHAAPGSFTLAPASADASFRRYFRLTRSDGNAQIVMDAPPTHEDCRPFVAIARVLGDAKVNVPTVHAQDLEQGFLLLSDLGESTYLTALNAFLGDDSEANAAAAQPLYRAALSALVAIQQADATSLPPYDDALLRRELELFPEWYLGKHLGITLDAKQRAALDTIFNALIDNHLAQPQVFVHRDYHSRNLMQTSTHLNSQPGVLDFQDAVRGPITYDLVSLLRDAYIEWPEAVQLDWAIRYWEAARTAGLPIQAAFDDFYRDFEWMGLQRHLKVLGIFARLYHRDSKDGYLKDLPLVLRYARKVCERYGVFRPLAKLFAQLDTSEKRDGVSF